jgi:DNA gyrase/topoisomerase IV subunit B
MSNTEKQKTAYDESTIEKFDSIGIIRQRPTVYIHAIGQKGVFKMVLEALDNSIDEFMMGRGKTIVVNIDSVNHTVECIDNGAGIPIGKLEDILCNLGCGGKFDKSSYEYSIGMNGMGTTIMNALSDIFVCEVWRDGKHAIAEYSKGRKTKDIIVEPNKDNHPNGTRIFFRPDVTVLYDIGMNYETYYNCFDLWCYVHPGMTIDYTYNGKKQSLCHPEGLLGYMQTNIIKSRKYHPLVKPIVLQGKTSNIEQHEFEIVQSDGSVKKEVKSANINM